MKKIHSESIFHLICSFLGISLIIIGTEHIIEHIFNNQHSLFHSVMFVVGGITIYTITRIYFMFLETLQIAVTSLEQFNARANASTSPQSPIIKEINITDQTPPEEIEKLKSMFPALGDLFGNFNKATNNYKTEYTNADIENIKEINDETLKNFLKQAVLLDDFENAAKFRDELSKRKNI